MSYEGYVEYICVNGHHFIEDCWSDEGNNQIICSVCKARAEYAHSVDETNGEMEDDPDCCTKPAPLVFISSDDIWHNDHYGNRYATRVNVVKPDHKVWHKIPPRIIEDENCSTGSPATGFTLADLANANAENEQCEPCMGTGRFQGRFSHDWPNCPSCNGTGFADGQYHMPQNQLGPQYRDPKENLSAFTVIAKEYNLGNVKDQVNIDWEYVFKNTSYFPVRIFVNGETKRVNRPMDLPQGVAFTILETNMKI